MKTSGSSIILALVAFASAQQLPPDLPACAQTCAKPYFSITPNYSSFAGCDVRDVACVCANKQFISEISCCVAKSCSSGDQKTAADFAINLCNQVSIPGTPPLPSVPSCSSTNTTSPTSTSSPASAPTEVLTAAGRPIKNPTIRGRVAR